VAFDFLNHGNSVPIHGLSNHTLKLRLLYATIIFCKKNKLHCQSTTDPIRLFYSDINKYELENPMAINGVILFLMVGDNQQLTGLLWNKKWSSLQALIEGGFIDFYIFYNSAP
jgi:hypothetical protein